MVNLAEYFITGGRFAPEKTNGTRGYSAQKTWYNRRMSQKRVKQNAGSRTQRLGCAIVRFASALALAALGLGWPRILAAHSAWVEMHYSETVYQSIRRAVSAATSLVPFSIAELLLYALAIGIPALLLIRVIQLALGKIDWKRLLHTISSVLLAGAIVLNLFYITWGFNYFREPLSERMGLKIQARSVDELEDFVLRTARAAKTLRATLREDARGVFSPVASDQQIINELPEAYAAISNEYPVFEPDPTRAKRVLWSRALSWQGIAGIYIGLTAEPNINADQPPLLLYQGAAHEMSHQTGIASENEAEFTAYLACLFADDPNVRYSGLMNALILAGNALYQADSARYLAATETYGDALLRDLEDYDAYWSAFDGEVRESADRRNDAYLKHNAQESGILSYGESVDLMLAFCEKYGGGTSAAVGQTKS